MKWSIWMLSWKKKKKSFAYILDNAQSHKIDFTRYLNIQPFFLPPNTTSILQPCDQAINAVTKAKYKAWLDDQRFNFHADPNKSTSIKIMTRINAKISKKLCFLPGSKLDSNLLKLRFNRRKKLRMVENLKHQKKQNAKLQQYFYRIQSISSPN